MDLRGVRGVARGLLTRGMVGWLIAPVVRLVKRACVHMTVKRKIVGFMFSTE